MIADVPCNGCTLCCRSQIIILIPDKDDIESYDHLNLDIGGIKPLAVLKQKQPSGDCIYLGDDGCTIHDRAPWMCREFDCRVEYSRRSRAERKRMVKEKSFSKEVFDRGRELLQHGT